MKFYQRLAYYLFGFLVGMVFLFMILNGKESGCSYFPNARVLKDLRSKPFYYSDTAAKKIAQKWLDTSDIRKTLTYGDIDFDKSNVKLQGGKLYIIEGKTAEEKKIILEVINYSNKAVLKDIKK
jgi:hypothetical protein